MRDLLSDDFILLYLCVPEPLHFFTPVKTVNIRPWPCILLLYFQAGSKLKYLLFALWRCANLNQHQSSIKPSLFKLCLPISRLAFLARNFNWNKVLACVSIHFGLPLTRPPQCLIVEGKILPCQLRHSCLGLPV